jgi:endonuclease YncB( thermonuclease family)
VLERRRIFKGRRTRPRMRGAAVLLSTAILTPMVIALGLPSSLFGSAPADRQWQADAPDIRIVDGETLALGDRIVRLAGMAAPARGEPCRGADGAAFDCGAAATAALTRLVAGRAVSCRVVGRDGFGRGIGQCEAHGVDLAASLVGEGFAVATGGALRPREREARAGGRGLWAHRPGAPQDWLARE